MTETVPWIERCVQNLAQNNFFERLPPGVLIDAQPYWGVEELAVQMVQRIVGMKGDPRLVPHSDVLWVKPEETQLKVNQIRDAIYYAHLSAQVASRKVIVLDGLEHASIEASNALLKSLEEPPATSHWLLISTAFDRLLPTIRSRCQRVRLVPGPEKEITNWLLAQGIPEHDLPHAMVEYGGAPYAILNALQAEQQSLRAVLLQVWKQPALDLSVVNEFKNHDLDDLLVRWMRITQRMLGNRFTLVAYEFWDELVATRRAIHYQTHPNPMLQLERLLILWSRLGPTAQLRKRYVKVDLTEPPPHE